MQVFFLTIRSKQKFETKTKKQKKKAKLKREILRHFHTI